MPVSSQATAHRWRTIGRAAAPRPRRQEKRSVRVSARAAEELHARTVLAWITYSKFRTFRICGFLEERSNR